MSSDESKSKRNDICEKLDECAVAMIECYQDILTKRSLLDQCLDDGYLNLSKARSLVGCASLSILQVPSDLESKVNIIEKEQESGGKHLEYKSISYDIEFKSDNKKSEEEGSQTEKKRITQAPFPNWFGVLTPLSLKNSHKSFSRSLYLITSICETQSKLNALTELYQSLLKQKKEIA